jgi:hypothetical protein
MVACADGVAIRGIFPRMRIAVEGGAGKDAGSGFQQVIFIFEEQ